MTPRSAAAAAAAAAAEAARQAAAEAAARREGVAAGIQGARGILSQFAAVQRGLDGMAAGEPPPPSVEELADSLRRALEALEV